MIFVYSYTDNKNPLQTMAIDQGESMGTLKSLLLSENFWEIVNSCVQILGPIVNMLNELQGDDCVIHKVFGAFTELERILYPEIEQSLLFVEEEKSYLMDKTIERKNFALKPVHMAAAKLDPNNQGFELNPEQTMDANEFMHDTAINMGMNESQVLADFGMYQQREQVWNRAFIWKAAEKMTPLLWWKTYAPQSDLTQVAIRILSAPSTSATVERSFSTFGWIHNKKRNRLTTERAGKLTYLSFNYKLCNEMYAQSDNDELSDEDTSDYSESCENQ